MEADNGGARMTATAAEMVEEKKKEEEEVMNLSKRRKIHDSDEIGDMKENLLATSSSSSSLVMNHGELSIDLKSLQNGEVFETVASTFGEFSIDTSLSGENFGVKTGETMESSSSSTPTKRKLSTRKSCCFPEMPSTAEIDDFFSTAEKSQQERFVKKYNYDIVKDVPMEGRYQWIPLKF